MFSTKLDLASDPLDEVAEYVAAMTKHIQKRFDDSDFAKEFPHVTERARLALKDLRVLTDATFRKTRCLAICENDPETAKRLDKAIQVARSSPNAQNAWLAWLSNGFGLSSKLITDYGLQVANAAIRHLDQLFDASFEFSNFPGIIARMSGSDTLRCHHDQIHPNNLISELEVYPGEDWREWALSKGVQVLVHAVGGKTAADSATFGYKNLTPKGLLIIMRFLRDGVYDDAAVFGKGKTRAHFFDPKKTSGPWFYNLEAIIGAINDRLTLAGLKAIHAAPICPAEPGDAAILAGFFVGAPHFVPGSKARRFTVTVPATAKRVDDAQFEKLKRRLDDLVDLADDRDEIAHEASKRLRAMTTPYCDGTAHKRPDLVVDLMGKDKPFFGMLPKKATVVAFLGKRKRGGGHSGGQVA